MKNLSYLQPETIPLPKDQEAEQAVLGAILIDGSVIEKVRETLSPSDFYRDAHVKIYEAMINLDGENKAIDLITLYDHLKADKNLLVEVGESSYLTYLMELVPATENVLFYAKIVKEKSRIRKLCLEAEEVSYKLKSGHIDIEEAGVRLEKSLEEISLSSPYNKIQFLGSEELIKGDTESIEWYVDRLVPKSSIVLITAPPGVFKTWFSLSIGFCIANGSPFLNLDTLCSDVYYIDKENPRGLITSRLRKIGTAENFKFSGSWSDTEAPNLDTRISTYKDLTKDDNVLIFDSLKRFHTGEENSATDMSKVMGSLRTLTRNGSSIIVLHHKGKSDSGYRGSSDILAGVDICYTLSKEGELLKLSCQEKNRFGEPFSVYLKINDSQEYFRFEVANSPKEVQTEADVLNMKEVIKIITQMGEEPIQGQIIKVANEKFGLAKQRVINLLERGEGKYWMFERLQPKNRKSYRLIDSDDSIKARNDGNDGVFQFANPIPTEKLENRKTEGDPWD